MLRDGLTLPFIVRNGILSTRCGKRLHIPNVFRGAPNDEIERHSSTRSLVVLQRQTATQLLLPCSRQSDWLAFCSLTWRARITYFFLEPFVSQVVRRGAQPNHLILGPYIYHLSSLIQYLTTPSTFLAHINLPSQHIRKTTDTARLKLITPIPRGRR